MSVQISGIFTLKVPSHRTSSKSARAPVSAMGGVTEPTDQVDLGPLGEELSGTALGLFSSLDSKKRGLISELVKSGGMSARDVTSALRGIARSALFDRYTRERPLTVEETRNADRVRELNDLEREKIDEMCRVLDDRDSGTASEFSEDVARLAQYQRTKGLGARTEEIKNKYDPEDGLSNARELGRLFSTNCESQFEGFNRIDFGDPPVREMRSSSETDQDNASRLLKYLDARGVGDLAMAESIDKYSRSVDIPGIGVGGDEPTETLKTALLRKAGRRPTKQETPPDTSTLSGEQIAGGTATLSKSLEGTDAGALLGSLNDEGKNKLGALVAGGFLSADTVRDALSLYMKAKKTDLLWLNAASESLKALGDDFGTPFDKTLALMSPNQKFKAPSESELSALSITRKEREASAELSKSGVDMSSIIKAAVAAAKGGR